MGGLAQERSKAKSSRELTEQLGRNHGHRISRVFSIFTSDSAGPRTSSVEQAGLDGTDFGGHSRAGERITGKQTGSVTMVRRHSCNSQRSRTVPRLNLPLRGVTVPNRANVAGNRGLGGLDGTWKPTTSNVPKHFNSPRLHQIHELAVIPNV